MLTKDEEVWVRAYCTALERDPLVYLAACLANDAVCAFREAFPEPPKPSHKTIELIPFSESAPTVEDANDDGDVLFLGCEKHVEPGTTIGNCYWNSFVESRGCPDCYWGKIPEASGG